MNEQLESQEQPQKPQRRQLSKEQMIRRRQMMLKKQRMKADATAQAPLPQQQSGHQLAASQQQEAPPAKPASQLPKPPALPSERRDRGRQGERRQPQHQHNHNQHQNSERISIVVPLYNEEESLRPLVEAIKRAMSTYSQNYEVILVDDGSTDRSHQILREICREERRFKYISFQKNFGKSAALQVGFQAATGTYVISMDADLQDDPNEIPNLIRKIKEGYDMVSGWKKVRYDPFIKKYSSRFFNYTTRVLSGIKIHDFNCGLKAYKKAVVQSITVYGELHRYIPVLAKWQGFSVAEIPVKHHPRKWGKTKFGISRFFKGFIDLLTVTFVTRYIKRPMHLFGFLGALAFFLGFCVNGYLSYEWFNGQSLSNRPMLLMGILLIIVGVQFFTTGLLGEMMVHNSQDTKEYRVKDKQLK